MLCIKVRKEYAEKVRRYLAGRKLSDNKYRIHGSGKFIYFPISNGADRKELEPLLRKGNAWLSSARFEYARERSNYREMLEKRLGKSDDYARGYDVIGDIAIVDARSKKSALGIANIIMKINKGIKTVLAKGGPVSGRFRTRKFVHVAGRKNFEATYRENGCIFRMDVRKTFFSPRLSYERGRVNTAAKDGENVIVMFAGVGPFAIEIAKAHKKSNVVAIELNRDAYGYMKENIKLNKVQNVKAVIGNVNKVAAKYRGFADRIVMPLPNDSYKFMGAATRAAKRRCIVHYYAFGSRDGALKEHSEKLSSFLRAKGTRFKVLSSRMVRPYSASEVEIVIDFEMLKAR